MNPVETWELHTKGKQDQREGLLSSPMKAKLFLLIHMEKIRPNYTLRFGTEAADSPQAFSDFPQTQRHSPLEPLVLRHQQGRSSKGWPSPEVSPSPSGWVSGGNGASCLLKEKNLLGGGGPTSGPRWGQSPLLPTWRCGCPCLSALSSLGTLQTGFCLVRHWPLISCGLYLG